VIVFAVSLVVITYLDRVCLSFASTDVQRDLPLSDKQMGFIFSSFMSKFPAASWAIGWGRAGC
jgi:hypothetical protein